MDRKGAERTGICCDFTKGGIQLVIEIEGDDKAQVAKANQAGLAVQALSRWRIASTGKGGILLSFTNITSAEMAE